MTAPVPSLPSAPEIRSHKSVSGEFSLDERYAKSSGTVLLSGIQAIVRSLQTRAQLDERRGLISGGFVSGYRGSPLGGLDKELWAQGARLQQHNITFQPGVNEDLAATAVWGTQQVGLHPGATVQGAYGLWYGKNPGLDRSCDAIRHANMWGTSATGGVLLVVGDDPAAKSSSLASQSEFTLQDLMVPILSPSDVQDVLDFSVLGWEMSRHSGLWVGLKAIADHMDSASTVEVGLERYHDIHLPDPGDLHIRREDTPGEQEVRILEQKLPAALEFARAANINRWVTKDFLGTRPARLGIVAAGKAYRDVREAFALMGATDEAAIRRYGVELLQLGMTWPLDDELIREFAQGCAALLVVEEKRAFVEPQVKDILYGADAVPVLGKRDLNGAALLPSTGLLDVDYLVEVLCAKLHRPLPATLRSSAQGVHAAQAAAAPARAERTPLFCAGCPHNTSTRVPEGSRATAGIGCHYMVQWMDRDTDSCSHMGGEGVTWLGESPFTDENHLFANLGDGTYFHSGILAIRQAVAAKVNITYKILFNDAVAMTGGQPTDGELDIASLIKQVQAEGVSRVVIVSDEPDVHRSQYEGVEVHHRSELDAVQRQMRTIEGTSVLIYQQTCATELRRRRKRGKVEDTRPRLMINEDVCEGCGDCTVQSNCVAVEPLVTPEGVKRQINQTACNKDLSCSTGFCPAFVEVRGDLARSVSQTDRLEEMRTLAGPELRQTSGTTNVLLAGVGGTGIVTVSALLAAAAKLDGLSVSTLDMTGLAQKGGAVFSHIRLGTHAPQTARIPNGQVDVLVGCDLVSSASSEALALMSERTHAVVNSHVSPTAEFVLQGGAYQADHHGRLARLQDLVSELNTLPADDLVLDALGGTQQTNVFLLGVAYQQGGIGISLAAMEEAIRINGVDIDKNLLAFHLGRHKAVSPVTIAQETAETLDEFVERSRVDLVAYQNEALAERFTAMVTRMRQAESSALECRRTPGEDLAFATARAYKRALMLKDEFEVARLYTNGQFSQRLRSQFADPQINYLLAPPLLGNKKRRFGSVMTLGFKVLSGMKGLRNTILDPFRYTAERKQGLAEIEHVERLCEQVIGHLTRQNHGLAVALISASLDIRGFGHVKTAKAAKVHKEQAHLLEEFLRPADPVVLFDPHQRDEAA